MEMEVYGKIDAGIEGNNGSDPFGTLAWLTGFEDPLFSPAASDIGDYLDLNEVTKSEDQMADDKQSEDSKGQTSVEECEVEETPKNWSRLEALERYKLKRRNRSYRKKIRYECRKKIAAGRPRSGGRFVKVANVE